MLLIHEFLNSRQSICNPHLKSKFGRKFMTQNNRIYNQVTQESTPFNSFICMNNFFCHDHTLPGHEIVYCCRQTPTFWRNLSPPKCQCPSTKPQDATSKNIILTVITTEVYKISQNLSSISERLKFIATARTKLFHSDRNMICSSFRN
jgi:hypothetical protein